MRVNLGVGGRVGGEGEVLQRPCEGREHGICKKQKGYISWSLASEGKCQLRLEKVGSS